MKKILFLLFGVLLYSEEFYYEYGKKIFVKPVKTSIRTLDCCDNIKIYKTDDGRTIKLKDEIVVKLKDSVNADDFFSKYNIFSYKRLAKNRYIVKISDDQDIFVISQKLYEDKDSIYAIPNKIKTYKKK